MSRTILAITLAAVCSQPTRAQEARPGIDWPQFRGIRASGVDDAHQLPSEWDVATGKNLRWKTRIPGLSHSSPIVWGDRVFVATAVAKGEDASLKIGLYGAGDSAEDMVEHAFQLWCLRLDDGRPIWMRTAVTCVPEFARHTKATHVDSTPVTDGKHVVAVFGSQGMFCYSIDGDRKWHVDLGDLDVGPHDSIDLHWGYASSPIIWDGKVIVQADVKKNPHLSAYDIATGEVVWRVERDDVTTWATPTVLPCDGKEHLFVNGCKHLGAYRLQDGAEIWRMAGGGGLPVPAPIAAGELVLMTSNHRPLKPGHPLKPVFAFKPSAKGQLPVSQPDAPGEHVAWTKKRVGNYIQTPIVYRGLVYLCATNGVVTVLDAKTGEQFGRHRLGPGGFSASAIAGDGKLWFTGEEGDVYVVEAGKDCKVIAQQNVGEICMATPALAAGRLLFRTRHHVLALGL